MIVLNISNTHHSIVNETPGLLIFSLLCLAFWICYGIKEIIKVIKVIKEKRTKNTKPYKLPNKCPICHSPTIKIENGALLKCSNISCPAQLKKSIEHFVSKKAMDIVGAEATINLLVESNLISNVADLYNLQENDLINLERFGNKSAKNLIDSINKSKNISLPKLIYALGIPNVGEYTSKILAEKYGNLKFIIK